MKLFLLLLVYSSVHAQTELLFQDNTIPLEKFKRSYSNLSEEAFNQKFKNSFGSPLLFFRSFVNTFYLDLSEQKKSIHIGTCFGDAHPENFGFLLFKAQTRFVFNDLDDSGLCSVEFDFLRYFVGLSLAFDDQQLQDKLLDHVANVFENPGKIERVSTNLIPNLKNKNRKIIEKYALGNRFKKHSDLEDVDNKLKDEIFRSLGKNRILTGAKLLDLARVDRSSGGSSGLDRYWILVKFRNGSFDILELKQVTQPGLIFLQSQTKESASQRLETVKNKLWNDSPDYYHIVKCLEKDFLIRSRTKDSVSLKDLSKSELVSYLKSQVSILALHHSKETKIESGDLIKWLIKSIPLVHDRYKATYLEFKKTNKDL